jgi:hypothetical protein
LRFIDAVTNRYPEDQNGSDHHSVESRRQEVRRNLSRRRVGAEDEAHAVIALALPQFALAHTSNGYQGTSGGRRATSAALPKAEIAQLRSHFRLVPERDQVHRSIT